MVLNVYTQSVFDNSQMIVFLRDPNSWKLYQTETRQAMETWPIEYIFGYDTIETFLRGYIDERVKSVTGNDIPQYFIKNDSIEIEEWTGYSNDNIDEIEELIRFRDWEYQQWGDGPLLEPYFNTTYGIWNEYVNTSRIPGASFPPDSISKNDGLMFFSPEKYRKVEYIFDTEIQQNGDTLYRYRINDKEWYSSALHSNSMNYRYGQSGLHDGVMRLDWTFNSQNINGNSHDRLPVLLSKGLFLDAPEYQSNISLPYGLPEPNPLWDDEYIDINPITGSTHKIHNTHMISLQINPSTINPLSPDNLVTNFSRLPTGLWIPQYYVTFQMYID